MSFRNSQTSRKSRIIIFGAGAVGQVLGRSFPAAETIFVDTNRDIVGVLRASGATAWDYRCFDASSLRSSDIVIIATKAPALNSVLGSIAGTVPVLTICNGLCPAHQREHVIGGVVDFAAKIQSAGMTKVLRRGSIFVEDDRFGLARRLRSMFHSNEVDLRIVDEIQQHRWAKVILNAAFEPVCTAIGTNYGGAFANPIARQAVAKLLNEGVSVARAVGHEPAPVQGCRPQTLAKLLATPVISTIVGCVGRWNARSIGSTLAADIACGRSHELCVLNEAVLAEALRRNVACPTHAAACMITREIVHGDLKPRPSHASLFLDGVTSRIGQPETLPVQEPIHAS